MCCSPRVVLNSLNTYRLQSPAEYLPASHGTHAGVILQHFLMSTLLHHTLCTSCRVAVPCMPQHRNLRICLRKQYYVGFGHPPPPHLCVEFSAFTCRSMWCNTLGLTSCEEPNAVYASKITTTTDAVAMRSGLRPPNKHQAFCTRLFCIA